MKIPDGVPSEIILFFGAPHLGFFIFECTPPVFFDACTPSGIFHF